MAMAKHEVRSVFSQTPPSLRPTALLPVLAENQSRSAISNPAEIPTFLRLRRFLSTALLPPSSLVENQLPTFLRWCSDHPIGAYAAASFSSKQARGGGGRGLFHKLAKLAKQHFPDILEFVIDHYERLESYIFGLINNFYGWLKALIGRSKIKTKEEEEKKEGRSKIEGKREEEKKEGENEDGDGK